MAPDPTESGQPDSSDTQRSDAQGKGKGVATKDNTKDAEEHLGGSSVVSRLGRSAADLSKSLLQGPPSADGLSGIASSGKPAPSSASGQPGAWAEGSFAPSGPRLAVGGSSSASFRSAQTSAHVAAEEEAFSNFLDNTSVLGQIEPVESEEPPPRGAASTAPGPARARYAAGSSVAQQEERDGAQVVRLLSQANEEPPSHDDDIMISKPELENLRRALFESGSAQVSASDWNNLLNLVPDFLRDEGSQTVSLVSSQMQLGVVDPSQAGQLWLEEWNRVLTSYTDEVWGDLGDLVHEARIEFQQIRAHQEKPQADPKSLRRLRNILTHVRARL